MGVNFYLHGVVSPLGVKNPTLLKGVGLHSCGLGFRQLLFAAKHGIDMWEVTAWAAHHNSSKDITEQEQGKRAGCFSADQSAPPWMCSALPCSPGQQAAPSPRCQEGPRWHKQVGSNDRSCHLYKKWDTQESSAPVSPLLPPCIPAEAQNRRAHYYNVVRALLVF